MNVISSIDFQIHSRHSYDAFPRIPAIVRRAQKVGLQGIVICDHEVFSEELKNYQNKNIIVIKGCEVKTEYGDIVGIGLRAPLSLKTMKEIIEEIHNQGGLVMLPHGARGHDLEIIARNFIKDIDIIEVYNARNEPEQDEEAVRLAQKFKKPVVAGSDAHIISEIGRSRVSFSGKLPTKWPLLKEFILHAPREIQGEYSPYWVKGFSGLKGRINKGQLSGIPGMIWRGVKTYVKKSISLRSL